MEGGRFANLGKMGLTCRIVFCDGDTIGDDDDEAGGEAADGENSNED